MTEFKETDFRITQAELAEAIGLVSSYADEGEDERFAKKIFAYIFGIRTLGALDD